MADGRWLQVNERRTRDGGFVSVGTDITALKEHEEQLLKSERLLLATVAQLRQSRRSLETQTAQLAELATRYQEQKAAAEAANLAKAEFLANMGHELRTPLNAIIGFAQMMQDQTFGPIGSERYRGYCSHILSSGQYLNQVFTDVLDMSRLESGRIQLEYSKFKVEAAIKAAADDVEQTAREKNLRLAVEVDDAEVLNADRGAIQADSHHCAAQCGQIRARRRRGHSRRANLQGPGLLLCRGRRARTDPRGHRAHRAPVRASPLGDGQRHERVRS